MSVEYADHGRTGTLSVYRNCVYIIIIIIIIVPDPCDMILPTEVGIPFTAYGCLNK
jgi:hypothetical protein